MKLSQEVRIGLVILSSIAILAVGINYLKGTNLFTSSKKVYAVLPSIDGLEESSKVILNGFQIGLVNSISFDAKDHGKLIIELLITHNELNIPKNSIVELINADFLGTKAIALVLGNSNDAIQHNDTLDAAIRASLIDGVTSHIAPFKEKADLLALKFDSVMGNINVLLKKKNMDNLTLSLINLNRVMLTYNKLAENLTLQVQNIQPTLHKINNVLDTINDAELKSTIANANSSLASIDSLLDDFKEGKGTLGKLAKNDSLYDNLSKVTVDLDKLLIDVKENPKKYVHFSIWGRKEKKKK